ncbi:hypothetical protein [Halobacterium bonnevillei]|uniref:Uncharacterized protein n=1 Tax=Halobacterium bonnevillei TaxID=2692200 RepID=A0A6B0SKV4_9EURY|nr:hypothetical protein [Halobacterium bonnevillei]MXR20351.1 hypothetical protein [Halobacterium bonnevillei]
MRTNITVIPCGSSVCGTVLAVTAKTAVTAKPAVTAVKSSPLTGRIAPESVISDRPGSVVRQGYSRAFTEVRPCVQSVIDFHRLSGAAEF